MKAPGQNIIIICIEPSVLILGMHVLFKRTPKIMDYHATFWMDLFCEHRSISIWMDLFTFNLHSGGRGETKMESSQRFF